MAESVWRRRSPLWLRIVAGILILPVLGLILVAAAAAVGYSATPLIWLFAIAAVLAWLIVRRAPTGVATALLILPLIGAASIVYFGNRTQNTFGEIGDSLGQAPDYTTAEPHSPAPGPQAEAPPPDPVPPPRATPGPDLDAPSGGGGGGGYHYEIPADEAGDGQWPDEEPAASPSPPAVAPSLEEPDTDVEIGEGQSALLPEFPWPPPAASASYVMPDKFFAGYRTVGDVTTAILAALEQNGYVERSFFRTKPGGVAMVTRLERINDDGSPSAARWPAAAQHLESTRGLLDFLQGLFFVDPGHYRVIVFVLQDLPFSQSAQTITAEQAHEWLVTGANVLPRKIADLSFDGGHVTVLIYEFASDGSKVTVIASQLTGKQHLEKAGVLTALGQAQ